MRTPQYDGYSTSDTVTSYTSTIDSSIYSSYGEIPPMYNTSNKFMRCINEGLTEYCILGVWCLHAARIQMFDFGIILALIAVFPHSLLPAALYAIVLLLSTALISPSVGHFVDTFGRATTMSIVVIIEIIGIIFTGVAAFLLVLWEDKKEQFGPFSSWEGTLCFSAVLLFTVPIAIGAVGINIVIEKDWAPTLFSYAYLPTLNARLGRLALFAEAIGPLAAGTLLQFGGTSSGVIILVGWSILSAVSEIILLCSVYLQRHELQESREKHIKDNSYNESPQSPPSSLFFTPTNTPQSTVTKDKIDSSENEKQWHFRLADWAYWFPFLNIFRGLPVFIKQRAVVLPVMSYAALWFTVLSTNSVLLIVFLKSHGFSDILLSTFRGAGALFGVLTTFVWPIIIRRLGLVWCSRLYLAVHVMVVLASAVFFHLGYGGLNWVWANWLFISLVVVTKAFLAGFAFGEVQIMQMGVYEEQRGIVNSFESGLVSISSLSVLLLGAILHNPNQFWILVWISAAFVFAGGCLFSVWSCDRRSVQFVMLRREAFKWAAETEKAERYSIVSSLQGTEEGSEKTSCSGSEREEEEEGDDETIVEPSTDAASLASLMEDYSSLEIQSNKFT